MCNRLSAPAHLAARIHIGHLGPRHLVPLRDLPDAQAQARQAQPLLTAEPAIATTHFLFIVGNKYKKAFLKTFLSLRLFLIPDL
jgi:hypothetical protein